jgi:hypothetical protein
MAQEVRRRRERRHKRGDVQRTVLSHLLLERDVQKGGADHEIEHPNRGWYYAAIGQGQTNVLANRGMSGNVQRCEFQVQ